MHPITTIDILTLIKWRELYEWLEETVDACKRVANDDYRGRHQGDVRMHFFETMHNFFPVDYLALSPVVLALIALALAFDFLNGLHDAANSIATVVSTRVLTPQQAVLWAAFFNFIAFLLFELKVAGTIGKGIIHPEFVTNSVIAGTLVGACAWNILTWYWGLPTSSSHALIGGFIGAGLAHSGWSTPWRGRMHPGKRAIFIVIAGRAMPVWPHRWAGHVHRAGFL